MLFFFFFKLSKVVLYEKSQNTAMQNICCEQRTKKNVNKKNSLKNNNYKYYNTIFLPDAPPCNREETFSLFIIFFTFFAPRVFLFIKNSSEVRGL